MKVLWLCNVMLPVIANDLKQPSIPFGGWIIGLANGICNSGLTELTICFPFNGTNDLVKGEVGSIKYYGFKESRRNIDTFLCVLRQVKPNIVHIFGTEYKHTRDMVNACKQTDLIDCTIISIQGLVSIIGKYHYYAGLPVSVIYANTLRDFFKHDSIKRQRDRFIQSGMYEIEALKNVKHVIGRTDWDRACVQRINPLLHYHFCSEILRDEFYRHTWSLDNCEHHSIFLSQSNYPVKGFHFMLEAMPEILKRYPNAHIYTTGRNPLMARTPYQKAKQTYYERYIGKLIAKYGLQDKVTFLGTLNEIEMCNQYLKANVFVSASSIENESNSVSEAKILGMPIVASFVGGITSRIMHNEDGLVYPYDAPYMLAYYVCKIFEYDTFAKNLGKNAQRRAMMLYDKTTNIEKMLGIYKSII